MKTLWRVLLGFLGTWTVGCGTESQPTKQPALEQEPRAVDKQELPYDIASRPTPIGDKIDNLLSPQVGPFRRKSLRTPEDIHTGSFYADYTRDGSSVFVELGICEDASHAEMALATAKAETDAEFPDVPQVFVKWQDVSCLRTVNRLGAFMAWTRGPYYFSVHAKGGEKDLDGFMAAFPY
ncbi:MAG: hypothetical protein L0228_21825 [Planctomycetes bacterium]|nr:hypothetical protein [Planctomycetota bacterium]